MEHKSRHYQGNPQKNSPALGAAVAYLGIDGLLALLHGSQGCSTFCRLQLSRHFKEPIPLNSTALLEDTAIFGGWQQLKDGIAKTADKYSPRVIGVMSAGLPETYGDDMVSALSSLRSERPELKRIPVVLASTPDYIGSMQEGYQIAVSALVTTLVNEVSLSSEQQKTVESPFWSGVAVFPGVHLTPGEVDEIKDLITLFGLEPVVVPDIANSLDGHVELEAAPIVQGGTHLSDFAKLPYCKASLTFGASVGKVGEYLKEKYRIPHYNFPSVTGLKATDRLVLGLTEISGKRIPEKIMRQRSRLLDTLTDYHDQLSEKKVALALESDLLYSLRSCLEEVGCKITAALAATGTAKDGWEVGDLEELENRAEGSQMIVANSNGRQCAGRWQIPHLRAGLPVFDRAGETQKNWIGYRGTQHFLFDAINTMSMGG